MQTNPPKAHRKKVCMLLLNDVLNPIDTRVYKEAKTLTKNGYEVHILCWARRYKPTALDEVIEGISIHRVVHEPGPVEASILHKSKVFQEVSRTMVERAKLLKPDIVHAHDLETLPIGHSVKKGLKTPLVFDAHEDWPALEARKSRLLGLLTRILQRWHIGSADAILTVNDSVADRLKGARVKKTVLYNARPWGEIEGIRTPIGRETIGLSTHDFVVGYLGRIDNDLGYDITLEAMKVLKKDSVRLLVVGGPDDMKSRYEKMASELGVLDACVFTGHVPYDAVQKYLSLMNVGLTLLESNPLHDIALGNRFFDYVGAGVPIISSNLPVVRSVIERIGCGVVLTNRDAHSLVDAIMNIKKNPPIAQKYRDNSLHAFKNEFCWERQEEKLLSVYKAL